jgi:hypothetical protein
MQLGIGNKRQCCVGCHLGLSNDAGVLRCAFSGTGFPFSDGHLSFPCQSAYHVECFRVGEPFTTRRRKNAGLAFPAVKHWPNFVCEACTVRAVADRELTDSTDWKLLCYERMRVIDMAHNWAPGTHRQYQQKLGSVRRFELQHGIAILRPTPLPRPPSGPEIPLMWFQEAYSLRKSSRRRDSIESLNVAFSTVRQFRSAVSQFMAWDAVISHPSQAFLDQNKRLIYQSCRPTDNLSSSFFSSGLSARIGDEPNPSVALLDRHIRWMEQDLNTRFLATRDPLLRHEVALAGLATLSLWLGWLRSMETFSLEWRDIEVVDPATLLRINFGRSICCRRGARTQVTRGGSIARYRFRKSSPAQVYEHARWRRKRSGEKIDVTYREWPLIDRLKITLYSM